MHNRKNLRMTFFLAAVFSGLFPLSLFNVQATAQGIKNLPYNQDFSTDPAWETNNPANFRWDQADGAYYSKSITGSGEFAGVQTDYNAGSFVIAFDIKVTARGTGGETIFGLCGPAYTSYQISPYDQPCIYISVGGSQNRFKIVAITDSGAQYGVYPSNTVELNKWYRVAMSYDKVNKRIGLTVRKRDGNPNTFFIYTTTNINGSFPSNMQYLGLSMVGEWASSGETQEAYLDNIKCVLAGAISGKVTADDSITPIAAVSLGASSYVRGGNSESNLAGAQTLTDGTYYIACIEPGAYRLNAFPRYGYGPQYYENTTSYGQAKPVYVQAGTETANINFTLAAGGKISGHVYEEDGVTPIAGEYVNLRKADDRDYNWGSSTNSSGFYSINVPYGDYKVKVGQNNAYKPEYYNAKPIFDTAEVVSVSQGRDADNIDFTLGSGTSLTGIVLDDDLSRVSGNEVHYYSYEMRLGGSINASTSDPLARLFLFALPDGWMRFHAHSRLESGLAEAGINPATGIFIDASENIKNFPLIGYKGALASGYIKDATGNPVIRGGFFVGGKNVDMDDSVDINGRYEARLPVGTHWLGFNNSSNPDLCALPKEITVTDTAQTVNIPDLVVYDTTTGSTISGQILDDVGTKQGNFGIYALQAGAGRGTSNLFSLVPIQELRRIDSAGPYTLTSLPPNNNYLVALGLGNSFSSPWYLSMRDFRDDLSVPATGVNLTYASIGGTVTGKVVDSANKPLAYATVLLSRQQDDGFTGYAYTNQNGEYTLYNFEPGLHNIIATHPRYPNSAETLLSVTDNQVTNIPDIVLTSSDEQAIRQVYESIKTAFNAGDVSGIMANYSDSYLHSGEDKNYAGSQLNDYFANFRNTSASYTIKSIDITGEKALVKRDDCLTGIRISDGRQAVDRYHDWLDYLRKESGTWRLYGDQDPFDATRPRVSVTYYPPANWYGIFLAIESHTINIVSAAVSGPSTGNVTLYDDGQHQDGEAGDGRWANYISLGTQPPAQGEEYEFTVTDNVGNTYHPKSAITNIFKKGTTLVSPANNAIISGRPLFSWQALPSAYQYAIAVSKGTSPNLDYLWFDNSLYGKNTSQAFFDEDGRAEDKLQNGQVYSWRVFVLDQDGNQTSTDYATFTYNNQSPILGAIGGKAIDENQKLEFTILASDPDGDALEYAVSNLPAGATFDAATRAFSWTPTYSQAGTYNNIVFTVTDGNASDSETIAITVNNINAPPQAVSITPASGTFFVGAPYNFSTTVSDEDSPADIKYLYYLVNTSSAGVKCFYAYYNRASNKLYLRDDAGKKWLGGFSPASSRVIENSYVKLDCKNTSVLAQGNNLRVDWKVFFKKPFTGNKKSYLLACDNTNTQSGWKQLGTAKILVDATMPEIAHSPVKTAKRNKPITFTATVTDSGSGVSWVRAYFTKPKIPALTMLPIGNNRYQGVLPAKYVKSNITYAIKAQDKAGNASATKSYIIAVKP